MKIEKKRKENILNYKYKIIEKKSKYLVEMLLH